MSDNENQVINDDFKAQFEQASNNRGQDIQQQMNMPPNQQMGMYPSQ